MGHGTELGRTNTGILPRERLTAALSSVAACRLALVTAPGGYGKTTVIRTLAEGMDGAAFCWLSLDPADASLPIFLQQLAAALARHLPGGGLFSVTPARPPSEAQEVRHLGRLVAGELDQHVEEQLIIVLDDLHHVDGSAQVMTFLDALLQYLPASVHLIAASRRKPPLPLARLQAHGQMVHLTASDLSFTPDEVAQLFEARLGVQVPAILVAQIIVHTEGWVTALLLLGNLLASVPVKDWGDFLRRFRAEGPLLEFLAEEVFAQQPDHLQDFLLGTAMLSDLQPPIIERLLGVRGAGALLQELEARNLFIMPVAGGTGGYRYHHLFQMFLRRQLVARRGEAELLRLHAAAAQVYEGLGNLHEAVEHYLDAGVYGRAAELMAEQVDQAIKSFRQDLMQRWLDHIPQPMLDTDPNAVYVQAQLALWAARNAQLPALYQRCLELYEARGDYRGLARALSHVTRSFYKMRHPYFREMSGRWAAHADPVVRIYGQMVQAIGRTDRGQWAEAFSELEQLVPMIPPATPAYFDCLALLGTLAFWRGDSRNALKYGVPEVQGRSALGEFVWGLNIWMSYCFIDDALGLESYQRQYIMMEVAPGQRRMHEAVGTLGQGIIHLYHRRWEDAQACFEALQPYFIGSRPGHWTIGPEATFTARLELAGIYARFGRTAEARTLHQQNLEMVGGYPEVACIAYAAMAQFLADQGDVAGARAHANRAFETQPPSLEGLTGIAVHLAVSRVALAEGNSGEARAALLAAFAIAQRQQCPWFFCHKAAPEMMPLLVEIARGSLPDGRSGQLVYAFIASMGQNAMHFVLPYLAAADPGVRSAAYTFLDQLNLGKAGNRVPTVKVYGLGPLRVYRNDQPLQAEDWKRNKVKLLLMILLLRRGKPVAKRTVTDLLWPEAEPTAARNNLRATLHGLRRALEPDLAAGAESRFLLGDRDSLWLGHMEEFWFDLWAFEDLIARARAAQRARRPEEAMHLLESACQQSRGAFLPEAAFADYFQDVRAAAEQSYLGICLEVAAERLAEGNPRLAAEYARRALLLDGTVEEAYQVLIEAHLAMGDREEAMHVYKTCRKHLRAVGSEPGPETRRLLNL